MKAFLAALLGHTVDSAIADFNRIADRLDGVAERHKNEVQIQADIELAARNSRIASDKEATRAQVIAGKIRALVAA